MNSQPNLLIPVILGVGCLGLMIWVALAGRKSKLDMRVEALSGTTLQRGERPAPKPRAPLPKVATLLEPTQESERTLLRVRLIQAGYYSPRSMAVFLSVKLILMVAPACLGLLLGLIGLVPLKAAALLGACLGIGGMIGPSFWLDHAKKKRHQTLARALPDAFDLLVICLEGGLTLQSGMSRIATEMSTAHPELSSELMIVQREVQLGIPESTAFEHMATRTDLEELKSLSMVIAQAEYFGASLVKALRLHAASSREHRKQKAEELAQQAGTKMLFPTLLFIFPSIFVVILGPAFFQIMRAMGGMMK